MDELYSTIQYIYELTGYNWGHTFNIYNEIQPHGIIKYKKSIED